MEEILRLKSALAHWNKRKGGHWVGPHPDKLPTLEKQKSKRFFASGKGQMKAACKYDSSRPASSWPLQCHSHGDARVMTLNGVIESWFQKAAAARQNVSGESLHGDPEIPYARLWKWILVCTKVDVGDTSAVRYLLRTPAYTEWNQNKRDAGCSRQSWRVGLSKPFDIKHGATGVSFPCWILIWFGPIISALCHYSSLLDSNAHSGPS